MLATHRLKQPKQSCICHALVATDFAVIGKPTSVVSSQFRWPLQGCINRGHTLCEQPELTAAFLGHSDLSRFNCLQDVVKQYLPFSWTNDLNFRHYSKQSQKSYFRRRNCKQGCRGHRGLALTAFCDLIQAFWLATGEYSSLSQWCSDISKCIFCYIKYMHWIRRKSWQRPIVKQDIEYIKSCDFFCDSII